MRLTPISDFEVRGVIHSGYARNVQRHEDTSIVFFSGRVTIDEVYRANFISPDFYKGEYTRIDAPFAFCNYGQRSMKLPVIPANSESDIRDIVLECLITRIGNSITNTVTIPALSPLELIERNLIVYDSAEEFRRIANIKSAINS